MNILTNIERVISHGSFMLVADGTYESSLILFDEIWNKEYFPMNGDIVIAIPARDLLLVMGSEDRAAIDKIKETYLKNDSDFTYFITLRLFVRKNGTWQIFSN